MNMEKEVIEGNKIIAEFMVIQTLPENDEGDLTRVAILDSEQLKYHTSWDWLMPVVKKIAGLMLNKDWDNLQEALARWKPIANELTKVESENVWYCVVQFIKWYNSTPQLKS